MSLPEQVAQVGKEKLGRELTPEEIERISAEISETDAISSEGELSTEELDKVVGGFFSYDPKKRAEQILRNPYL